MDFKLGRFIAITFAILLGANIAVYGIYHITYLIDATLLDYIFVHIANAWDYLFPMLVALLMMTVYVFRGGKGAALASVATLMKYPYLVMYDYLNEFRNFGDGVTASEFVPKFEFSESMVIALIGIIITYLQILFLYAIGMTVYKKAVKKATHLCGLDLRISLGKDLARKSGFDLTKPASTVVFSLSITQFIINGGMELYDTISYFMTVGTAFTAQDILYIAWRFVFLIALIPLCHLIASELMALIFRRKYRIAVPKARSIG